MCTTAGPQNAAQQCEGRELLTLAVTREHLKVILPSEKSPTEKESILYDSIGTTVFVERWKVPTSPQ